MFRIITVLLVLVSSSFAMASFGHTDCSNADGTIVYKYRFFYANPIETNEWTINGAVYQVRSHYAPEDVNRENLLPPTVEKEDLTEVQVLESSSTSMTGQSTYTNKVKLTYHVSEGKTEQVEAWVICSSASGI